MAHREEFWISQLGKDIHKNVFFVLGAGHRETLRRRLERRAIEVKILEKRFGVSNLWSAIFPRTGPPTESSAVMVFRRSPSPLCPRCRSTSSFVAFMLHLLVIELIRYQQEDGVNPIRNGSAVSRRMAKARIGDRVRKIQSGNLGDSKPVAKV